MGSRFSPGRLVGILGAALLLGVLSLGVLGKAIADLGPTPEGRELGSPIHQMSLPDSERSLALQQEPYPPKPPGTM